MKKIVLGFLQKGFVACGFGPMVLVILYWILQRQCDLQFLSVNEVCTGIISLSVLAFIAGGMNVIYRIERLPLAFAILIHGSVLYISYLCTYLVNRWLEWGKAPVIVFTAIFVLGYLTIWAIIYWTTQKRTARLNEMLKQKQNNV
ncbi:MAG: DUF3021 domain-containing protein [Oscillospiraceae bacterium]